MPGKNKKLEWLEEIEQLAEDVLSQQETSGCDQVHPLIRNWYVEALEEEPPASRPAVLQAMACLTTEVMTDMPESLFKLMSEHLDEDEVAMWLHEVLMIGRAFEQALQKGRLDDL